MPNVQLSLGPMLIGVFFNTILYGVIVVQILTYYQTYKQDKAWLRYFVLYLFIVDTVNTGMDIAVVYEPLILQFDTPESIKYFPLALAAGAGIWLTVGVTQIRLLFRIRELTKAAPLWLFLSAATDIIITSSLITILYRQKTGVKKTDDLVNKIIRLTIQTGSIITLFAILDVVCFLAIGHTAIMFIWDFPLAKLYMNTLMSSLNARATLRGLDEQADDVLFASNVDRLQFRMVSISDTRAIPTLQSAESHDPESIQSAAAW